MDDHASVVGAVHSPPPAQLGGAEIRTVVCHVNAPDDGLLADRASGPKPGDIFEDADFDKFPYLSAKYHALPEPRRHPIVVCLPTGTLFCVDSQQSTAERGFFEPGWDVSGPIEALTVSPSINVKDHWHGFLQNGVLRGT